eukprot:Seg508.8 transcript_id=Seg508.8/GoldUCD/mRNA.D3Y31 product="hypothetical protein" protein_id=Seg508.8/GoldUCD/D3Y31
MGGSSSNLLPAPMGFEFMCIHFTAPDRIKVIYANDQEINIIRETIMHHWSRGIQEEMTEFGTAREFKLKGIQEEMTKFGTVREFKLKGNPFSYMSSAEQAIEAKKLATQLLYKLYNFGCKLLVSSDLSMTIGLTTWIFHREQTIHDPDVVADDSRMARFVLSLNGE